MCLEGYWTKKISLVALHKRLEHTVYHLQKLKLIIKFEIWFVYIK